MARANVIEREVAPDAAKSVTRILRSGVRVRVRRHGETDADKKRWQDKLVERGFPSTVFDSQATMDAFIASVKAVQKRMELLCKLERQYHAGKLAMNRDTAIQTQASAQHAAEVAHV